jgi:aldehyde dehydrogenase (NAD+)
VYVQEKVYDEFLIALKAKAEACAIGLPEDEKTSFGPLVSLLDERI